MSRAFVKEYRFFYEEFIMTLKKINKRGQAIFEYFILTAAVVAVVLFFATSPFFRIIQSSCENAFNVGVEEMLR